MGNAQDWQESLHDLSRRRQQAHEMGGAERLAKHGGDGKLDARGRVDYCSTPARSRSSARWWAARSPPTASSRVRAKSTGGR